MIQKADYDPETRLAIIRDKKYVKKGIRTKYVIHPDHIFYRRRLIGVEAYAIVNVAKRLSMKLGEIRHTDSIVQRLEVDEKVAQDTKNMLDYLTESKFWEGMMAKFKIPLIWVLAYMLAGAGIYSFLRMILSIAFNYHLP